MASAALMSRPAAVRRPVAAKRTTGAPARRRRPTRRMYALRRLLASTLVLAVLLGAFFAVTALRSEAAGPAPLEATVVVAPGETVWDIAVEYLPEGQRAHAYVAAVLRHNDLDAASVPAGTVLRLPRS